MSVDSENTRKDRISNLAREELAAEALILVSANHFSPRNAVQAIIEFQDHSARPVVTALLMETIRRKNTIIRIINHILLRTPEYFKPKSPNIHELPLFLQNLLQVTFYRVLFEIPSHPIPLVSATIQEIMRRRKSNRWIQPLQKWFILLENFDFSTWISGISDRVEAKALSAFQPTWLVRSLLKSYNSEVVEEILGFFNNPSPTYVRINSLKPSNEVFIEFAEKKISYKADEIFPNILRIENPSRARLPTLSSFLKGHFFIQARTSAYIPLLVSPHPYERILDACAAPGGKTIFMAELMMNKGQIIALDVRKDRVEELKRNVSKYGVTNVVCIQSDVRDYISEQLFDRILVDAPCSGSGTLSTRPHTKWRITKQRIKLYATRQYEILLSASKLLKEGGCIYYSTCSLLAEENEEVISKFLADKGEEYVPESMDPQLGSPLPYLGQRFLPHTFKSEGFSIFCLKKL